MREILIDLSNNNYPNKVNCGFEGEHKQTKVIVKLPSELVDSSYSYKFAFGTPYGEKIIYSSSELSDNQVNCILEQDVTVSDCVAMQVEAYKSETKEENNVITTLIAKTPIVMLLIKKSVEGKTIDHTDIEIGGTAYEKIMASINALNNDIDKKQDKLSTSNIGTGLGIDSNGNPYINIDTIKESTNKKIMTSTERTKLSGVATGANKTVIDTALSDTSKNPVANSVISSTISGLSGVINTKANKKQMFAVPILSSSFVLGGDIEELLTSDYYIEVLKQNCGSWYASYYAEGHELQYVEANKGEQLQPTITSGNVTYKLKELIHGNEGEVDSSLPDEYYIIGVPLDLSRENDLALATKILAIALSNGAAHNDYYAAQLSVLQNAVMKTTEEINTVKTTTSVSAIDINLDSKNKAFKLDEMKLTILFPAGTMQVKNELRIYLYNSAGKQDYLIVNAIEGALSSDYLISCVLKKELSKNRRTLTYTKSLNYGLGNVMSIPSWQNVERGPISKIKICFNNPDTNLLPSGITVKVEGVKL